MRWVCFLLSLTTIMYAQNEMNTASKPDYLYYLPCAALLNAHSQNVVNIPCNYQYVPGLIISASDQNRMDNFIIKALQKSAWSDSSKKRSRTERALERKRIKLQELADRYTIEELQQRIENYRKSKTSGTILMSIGIPMLSAGLVATFVGLNNVDRSNSDGDEGWAATALIGEIVATAGGILTAYGIIKSAKASSRENKFRELLEIKTGEIGIKFDQTGLSFCYLF
jgi:hypothetical protein